MPAGDNPHSISEKKAALRESPKQSKNDVNQQARASTFPKDKVAGTVGIKRPQPNAPLSLTNQHAPGNPGANGHLVYVRRKLETDQNKGGASAGAESANSVSSKKPATGGPQEQSLKLQNSATHAQAAPVSASPAAAAATANASHTQSAPVSASPAAAAVSHTQSAPVFVPPAATVPALHPASLPAHLSLAKESPGVVTATTPALHSAILPAHLSLAKQSPGKATVHPGVVVTASPPHRHVVSTAMPQNLTAANTSPCNVAATSTAPRDAVATTTTRNPANPQRSGDPDWKARFLRLQAFLRNNEQSGQEEYIRMLQSLSSAGRSKHAIELEKRAVNLLIEEGKELQKMKALNVLGKLPPTDHPSLPTQPTFGMRLPFQPFPARR
ncbi:transcriptional regulatory protein AlgP-like [Triticum dicoccoides]|uniref:transcriptional regulatory protein AlgP-like n=1 Tax=Triticum dicoccoides TaxID=85692 RepID=UPI0018913D4A|nr:transcriptional regulatory protein AlgP-like [Triticum dicoccoides]